MLSRCSKTVVYKTYTPLHNHNERVLSKVLSKSEKTCARLELGLRKNYYKNN
jgi:hypothetical protein